MKAVPLGASGLSVSRMALGSWRTFERIGRDRGLAVMHAARDAGITFLDDARYNDETGTAPIPTGYSEVVFGELFRAAGWVRDDVIIANKLWWEFWPDESAQAELDGSLSRMGLDHVDLIYSEVLPPGLPLPDAVEMITGLISSGKARAWGGLNWSPADLEEAWRTADQLGVPGPTAFQPSYSLVEPEQVEDPALQRVATERGIAVVASNVLAGGVLTGKYSADPGAGRAAGHLDPAEVTAGRELAGLAADLGLDPAQLALAFALLNPVVTALLFGATTPAQVAANVGALRVAAELTPEEADRLRTLRRRQ